MSARLHQCVDSLQYLIVAWNNVQSECTNLISSYCNTLQRLQVILSVPNLGVIQEFPEAPELLKQKHIQSLERLTKAVHNRAKKFDELHKEMENVLANAFEESFRMVSTSLSQPPAAAKDYVATAWRTANSDITPTCSEILEKLENLVLRYTKERQIKKEVLNDIGQHQPSESLDKACKLWSIAVFVPEEYGNKNKTIDWF